MVTEVNPWLRLQDLLERAANAHWSKAHEWQYAHESYRMARSTKNLTVAIGCMGLLIEVVGTYLFAVDSSRSGDGWANPVLFGIFGALIIVCGTVFLIGFPEQRIDAARKKAEPNASDYFKYLQQDLPGRVNGDLVVSYRSKRPMAYVVFRQARLDIWPSVSRDSSLRFIVRRKTFDGFETARLSPVFTTLREALEEIDPSLTSVIRPTR